MLVINGYEHKFVAGPSGIASRTLLLLHGTGGDENDLIPLGRTIAPDANLLSPRGNVPENGMNRFFRRLAEGVFDQEDLRIRTEALAGFLASAAQEYKFDPHRVIAVGYSNGANIAASLLLRRLAALQAAILMHAMVPLIPETVPDLTGKHVFISAGRNDPIVPEQNTLRLIEMLRNAGANVTPFWHDLGHSLTREEALAAKVWLAGWSGTK